MAVIPFQAPRILQGQNPAQKLEALHATRLAHYHDLRDFYAGKQFRSPRRGHTNLIANYARAVVEKHAAFLFARGVIFQGPEHTKADPLEVVLATIFEQANLNRTLLQAAINASVLGDAVLKVIASTARSGEVPLDRSTVAGQAGASIRILNIDPARFLPTFASDDPSQLLRASITWQISPEEAESRYHYQTGRPVEVLETWTIDHLKVEIGNRTVTDTNNPYGFIPFIHVPNLAPPNALFGRSDLEDIIPLNQELNLRLSDAADAIRYHADPPVIFKGIREHSDLAVGPGTVWDIPSEASVDLLEWRGQVPAVDSHIERILRALYDVSESPRSSFGDTTQAFSGVAIEMQLQPIVQRTLRRRIAWEPALRTLARYTLLLAEQFDIADARASLAQPQTQARVVWLPMLPKDDDAEANRYIALTASGLRSITGAMEAMGLPDPEAELTQAVQDRAQLGTTTQATPAESGSLFIPTGNQQAPDRSSGTLVSP